MSMGKRLTLLVVILVGLGVVNSSRSLYDFKVKDITGKPVDLNIYKGKVLLIVNTACQCGYTSSHLKELNRLHRMLLNDGKPFEILAFPCNDFGQQDPGSPEEIKQFVTRDYQCKFPLMEKVKITEENRHPFWKYIIDVSSVTPEWNFYKYLFNSEGKFLQAWPPSIAVKNIFNDIKAAVGEAESLLDRKKSEL